MKRKAKKLFVLSEEPDFLIYISNRKLIKYRNLIFSVSKRIAPFNLFCPKYYKRQKYKKRYKQIPNKIYVLKLYIRSNKPKPLKRRSKIYAKSLY